ncbi:MAG: hypothetical protein R3284_02505 [Rubricoccaceae bacterium]|nr:hypothetical protein [Rubricoccaceae bacterium]
MPSKKSKETSSEAKVAVEQPGNKEAKEASEPKAINGTQPAADTSYEMPDDYAGDTFEQVRRWIEENPVLAVAGAAGVGFVAGQLLALLGEEPEPPSFSERVEKKARRLRSDAAHVAGDAGEALAQKLRHAADVLSDAAETASEHAGTGYERASDLADVVADAAKAAVAGVVAKKADSWFSKRN